MQTVIFQPCVQGLSENRPSSEPGTGLGLAIVRQLVQLMNGAISLQSQPGTGATFRITLPLRLPPENFAARPSSPASGVLVSVRPVAAAEPPPPLAAAHAAALLRILDGPYPVAISTQSTSDVQALVKTLKALAEEAGSPWLAARAEELRLASSTFAVSTVTRLLEHLPVRLAPLTGLASAPVLLNLPPPNVP